MLLTAVLPLSVLGLTRSGASDPMASLRFLVGNWTCTYHLGAAHVTYKATFAYDMGGNWMHERDFWPGGGSDEALVTYEPKQHTWTAVVVENERTTTVFRANDFGAAHIVYQSVYPDASMTEVVDSVSPQRYALRFSRAANGKVMQSFDSCVKH
jgi:hypothetical protein